MEFLYWFAAGIASGIVLIRYEDWRRKKSPPDIKSSRLWKRQAEGLEGLLNDTTVAEAVISSTEESAPEKETPGPQLRQAEGESEAITAERAWLEILYKHRVCCGLGDGIHLYKLWLDFQSVLATLTNRTATPQEVPEKQTSSHRTVIQQGKRYAAVPGRGIVEAPPNQTGSEISEGSSGKGTWANLWLKQAVERTNRTAVAELIDPDNQITDPLHLSQESSHARSKLIS